MDAFRESQIRLYAKQIETGAAVFLDCPAAELRDRYVGQLIYEPGKTYALTHRKNAIQPKLFMVLQYLPPEAITQEAEVELLLRYFNPFTQEPRSISRVRFPHCLNDLLSPELWRIEVVNPPHQTERLDDVIVPLPMRLSSGDKVQSQASQTAPSEPQQIPAASGIPTSSRKRKPVSVRPTSTPSTGIEIVELRKNSVSQQAKNSDQLPKAISVNSNQQFEFAASDRHRVREILKRWVQMSESTAHPWRITYKKDEQGFTIRDSANRVVFDYHVAENNVLSTTQSGLALQEILMTTALEATTRLSPRHERQLLEYAQEVLDRIQIASTETASGFMRSLFNLTPARRRTKQRFS